MGKFPEFPRVPATHHIFKEVLGSSEQHFLPWDDEEIRLWVGDEDAGQDFLEQLRSLKVGEHLIVNEHDPVHIERWTRTA